MRSAIFEGKSINSWGYRTLSVRDETVKEYIVISPNRLVLDSGSPKDSVTYKHILQAASNSRDFT